MIRLSIRSENDFSTLYTKIPHDDLIDRLSKVISFVFEGTFARKIRYSGHLVNFGLNFLYFASGLGQEHLIPP